MNFRVNVKDGERLILRTRQHPRKLMWPIIAGLILAPGLGAAAALILVVLPQQLTALTLPTVLIVLLQILFVGLLLLMFVVPVMLRPLVRYFRNSTWLTNRRLVHQRFFKTAKQGNRFASGFGSVTIALESVEYIYLKHQRGNRADVFISHSGGQALLLPSIPSAEIFVHQMQAQVSKVQVRTNVEQGMFNPGNNWGRL